jgi:DNA repair exonuclease SbcCD nuclease subunit
MESVSIMARLLQFGDIHIDGVFENLPPERAAERRWELRATLIRTMQKAISQKVDLILIPGDLYEDGAREADTSQFLMEQFESVSPIPVFIAPGNHDYYAPESLLARRIWPSNVRVATSPRFEIYPTPDGEVAVHMFAHTSELMLENLLQGYRVPQDDRLHVLNFHGGLNEEKFGEKRFCAPFSIQDLEGCGAHWASVGHYHMPLSLAGSQGQDIGAYAGWLESHNFKYTGAHSVLLVTLQKGAAPEIKRLNTSRREYCILQVDANGTTDLESLVSKIQAETDISNAQGEHAEHIVRIEVKGKSVPGITGEMITEALPHHCFSLETVTDLQPEYNLDSFLERRDASSAFVASMQEKIAAADPKEEKRLTGAFNLGLQAILESEEPS